MGSNGQFKTKDFGITKQKKVEQESKIDTTTISFDKIYNESDLKYPISESSINEVLYLAPTKLTPFDAQQKYELIDMLIQRDSQLQACLQNRVNTILQMPFELVYSTEDNTSKEAGLFIEYVLYKVIGEGLLNQYIEELLRAIPYGFSVSEVSYKFENNKIIPYQLNNWHQNNFQFRPDGTLVWVTNKNDMNSEGIPLDPKKFIVHKHNSTKDNPYGVGVVSTSVFWASYRKQYLFNYSAALSERHANPYMYGKVPSSWSDEQKKTLGNALMTMVNKGSLVTTEDVEIIALEAGEKGKNIILDFINACDEQIALAILGQRFTTTGGDTGSYARDKVAKDISYDIIRADTIELQNTLNNWIQFIISINFPDLTEFPIIKFALDEEEDLEKQANILKTITQDIGMDVPKSYAYEHLNIPMPAEGEEVIGKSKQQSNNPFDNMLPSLDTRPSQSPIPKQVEDDISDIDDNANGLLNNKAINIIEFASKQSIRDAEAIIELTEKSIKKITKAFNKPFQVIIDAASKIKDPSELENFNLKGKDLEEYSNSIFDAMFFYYASGYWLARRNMGKIQLHENDMDLFIFNNKKNFASVNYVTEPMPFREAIEYFKDKIPALIGDFDLIEEKLRSNAFFISRATSYVALEKVKAMIDTALRNGTWTSKFIDDNRQALEDLGFSTKNPYYINNVFRTNLATAYASGQYAQQTDPAVARLVPYFTYVAVNDDSTRPGHAAMNGVSRLQDDPIWDEWYPPNGYQCRCTVVATSKRTLERLGYNVTSNRNLPDVNADKGFQRNTAKDWLEAKPPVTTNSNIPQEWGT